MKSEMATINKVSESRFFDFISKILYFVDYRLQERLQMLQPIRDTFTSADAGSIAFIRLHVLIIN